MYWPIMKHVGLNWADKQKSNNTSTVLVTLKPLQIFISQSEKGVGDLF